jgi:hypothetical protein
MNANRKSPTHRNELRPDGNSITAIPEHSPQLAANERADGSHISCVPLQLLRLERVAKHTS